MNEFTVKHEPKRRSAFSYIMLALGIGSAIIIMFALVFMLGNTIQQRGKIFPGVSMGGVDLSGMTLNEAQEALSQELNYQVNGKILLVDRERSWLVAPAELGFFIDPQANAQEAYEAGRQGIFPLTLIKQIQAWSRGLNVDPVAIYNQPKAYAYLQALAREIDVPVFEANLSLENAQVMVNSGQIGRTLNIESTLTTLDIPLMSLQDGVIELIIDETPPVILDVTQAASVAEQILSAPMTLSMPDGNSDVGPWTIPQAELANLLTIKKQETDNNLEYVVGVNRPLLQAYLLSLVPVLEINPVNAHFIFNDDTRKLEVIQPAIIGRKLDVEASLDLIDTGLMAGNHAITLSIKSVDPAAKDSTTGEELGITELVHAETSYFYGSDPARVQNIRTAAKQFHGLLIPPNTTFSMAEALGNISLENGYAEALIIYGDQTIKGVGGGVCQVSTTLFRAAFFSGFPIVERHAHAYRVSYYEQKRDGSNNPNLAGLDATVYVPIVDLKFTNDTPYWLLMETYMGDYYSLTWKFYSTSDNRRVDYQTSGPTNIIKAPEPLYRLNPDLAEGEIKKVDYAADGAYIRVDRDVYRNGEFYFEDNFITQYQPWQAVYEYGPGTKDIPTPAP